MTNLTINGTFKWAKVQKPDNRYPDPKTQGGKYSIDVHIDKATQKKLIEAGLKHRIKVDVETGDTFIKPSRKEKKMAKGKIETQAKPVVTLNGKDFSGLVGNDSKGEVTIRIYDLSYTDENTGKEVNRKEMELMSVNVTELVEYNPEKPVESSVEDDDKPF